MVVVLGLLADPLLLDGRRCRTSRATGVAVWNWLWSPGRGVEDTRIRSIEVVFRKCVAVGVLRVPRSQSIPSGLCNVGEDIGADIPATEGVEIPVSLDGRDLRVVVVVVGIGSADELFGYGIAEEDGEDFVLDAVGLVLIEGDEDEGVVHEVLVLEEGSEESLEPFSGDGDGGVVSIRGHVWSDEQPLRKFIVLEVDRELGRVLDQCCTLGFRHDGIVEDFRAGD